MAYRPQASFSTGELDPRLHERTTLDKYKNGLKTGRNAIVTKTGSVLTRPSRRQVVQTKLDDREVVMYSPPRSGYMLEWGHLYVRIYTLGGLLLFDTVHDFTESDIPNLRFETSGVYVYIFCAGKNPKKLKYTTGVFTAA